MSETKMNSVKATNTFDGVLLLGQDESMLLSVGNTEKLRDQLNECLLVAAGKREIPVFAEDLDPKQKIVLNGTEYTVKNVLSGINDTITVQAEDYFGLPIEVTVDEDFEFTVREPIE